MKTDKFTGGQKCFLIGCVGAVIVAVLGAITYLLPQVLDHILGDVQKD